MVQKTVKVGNDQNGYREKWSKTTKVENNLKNVTNNDECDQEWQKRSVNDKIQTDKMTKSEH